MYHPGEWVLVTAAAGGVGIAACQLAKGLPHSNSLHARVSSYVHIQLLVRRSLLRPAHPRRWRLRRNMAAQIMQLTIHSPTGKSRFFSSPVGEAWTSSTTLLA